jgi:hypothetical protein
MEAWIQSADASSKDLALEVEDAVRLLSAHSWAEEESMRKSLESERKDFCPAGFGLVRGDGNILHVCPDGVSSTIYWMDPYKALGFVKLQRTHAWIGVPLVLAQQAIRHYFAAEYAMLKDALADYREGL